MKIAAEGREILTVDVGGSRLFGTYHRPPSKSPEAQRDRVEERRIGVLFLSAGVSPRSAIGDSAVYWAESLAKCGYPTFRFDLRGLGDSEGDFVAEGLDFDSFVSSGSYAPIVSGIVKDLVERFGVSGVIVIGHCSGAVTALYSAAANERIQGLILLDPYFHVPTKAESVLARSHSLLVRKLVWERTAFPGLRDAAMKLLSRIRNIYHRFLRPIHRLVRQKKLPSAANLPLIRCWTQLASTGFPMLVLVSPSLTRTPGEFDYISNLRRISGSDCRITVKLIEGITHSFEKRLAKEAIAEQAEQWLSTLPTVVRRVETPIAELRAQEFTNTISRVNPLCPLGPKS